MSSLKLFPSQENAIEMLREGFRQGHRAQILYAPCSFGKTELSISIMKQTADNMNRAAMFLDRVLLCNQTSERMDRYKIDHGVMQSGHWRYRPHERIQVCSAQTIEKRGAFPDLKFGLIDECHSTRKMMAEFIGNAKKTRFVGLSASPFTKGLGSIYTNVVNATTMRAMEEEGRLTPLRVFVCKEIDMTGAKKEGGEWTDAEAAKRGMQVTGDIVTEWVKKTTEMYGGPKKTIIFCANVAHGVQICEQFAEAGYNFQSLSYKDDADFKNDVLKEFDKPDTDINGLVATDILSKGFDCRDVFFLISARPFSKSFSSWVQQLGRGQRTHPSKEVCVLLDHSGNYLRWQEQWEDLFANGVHELVDGKEVAQKEPSEQEKKEARCPKCNCVWPPNAEMCPSCGMVRVKRSEIVTVPGAMEEVASASDRAVKQQWYSGLLYLERARGYKPGWAFAKFNEKFKSLAKGYNEVAVEPTMEMVKWEHSRRIAWAKSKKRTTA